MIKINDLNINCLSLNQDNTLLAVGTQIGYMIFSVRDFQKLSDQVINIDIIKIELYYKSNIVYYLGSHSYINLIIHDDITNKVQKSIQTETKILKVIARTNNVNILTINKILIYDMECEQLIISLNITTIDYPNLVASLNDDYILSWANQKKGFISFFGIKNFYKGDIKCEDELIYNFNISFDGLFFATCTIKGTKIKIFKLSTKELVAEYKRGMENCIINNLCFGLTSYDIICNNNKGSLHFFNFNNFGVKSKNQNSKTSKLLVKNEKSKGVFSTNSTINFKIAFIDQDENIFLANKLGIMIKLNYKNNINNKKEFFKIIENKSFLIK